MCRNRSKGTWNESSAGFDVLTGLEFDASDAIRPMDTATWLENRRRLDDLGGPPKP